MSWPISGPAGAGLTGFGCGPVGTHPAGAGFTGQWWWSSRDPSPSWKGDLLVIFLWDTAAWWACPILRKGIAGGCHWFVLHNLLWQIPYELSRAHCHLNHPAVHLWDMQCLLVRRSLIGRSMWSPLPSGWIWVPHFDKGCNVSLCWSHCLGCNGLIMEFWHIRKHLLCAIHISDVIKENNQVHHGILKHTQQMGVCPPYAMLHMMSSSEMEEASSRVPSLLVMETTNNLSWHWVRWLNFPISWNGSAEEVTDIFGEILLYLLLLLCRVDPAGLQVCMNNTLLTKIIACHLRWQAQLNL